LRKWIPDDSALRSDLAQAYFSFRLSLEQQAKREGLNINALDTYMKEASKVRNQNRPDLVLSHKRVLKFWSVADEAIKTHNGSLVERFIQDLVDQNTFNFKDVAPYQVVIRQTRKPAEGLTVREIYDAKKARYATIVRIFVGGGAGYLNGLKYSTDSLAQISLEYKGQAAKARPVGEYLEFEFGGISSVNLSEIHAQPSSNKCSEILGKAL
jgi:hypothetical protein